MVDRDEILRKLVDIMYTRNDAALGRGTLPGPGETLEVFPAYAETAYRAVFFGDEIEQVQQFDPLTGEVIQELEHVGIWPATHYATDRPTRRARDRRDPRRARGAHARSSRSRASCSSRTGCASAPSSTWRCCASSASATASRTTRASSTGAQPGERPYCLLDFFPDDFVCFIDESHQTVPQIGGMYEGDRSRKQTLVEYGFRLPSALDNRPADLRRVPRAHAADRVRVGHARATSSATTRAAIVEQIVRPTGVVDPEVDVRETKNQIDDLMEEIRKRVEVEERTLVTTLTKKMAEDLTDYLLEYGFKVRYLHSEIDTLERIQIIRELRLGEFDVLVGVNLLREGLDLPEVSLVAILDADKEGFLRGETSLIQTIGRAARNIRGTVIMYADKETAAMRSAIGETDRRRAIQVAYNEEHGITPATIQKGISDITDFLMMESKVPAGRGRRKRDTEGMSAEEHPPHDRGARGGDAGGRRRPALRVRRQAARRDQGAAARAGRGRGERLARTRALFAPADANTLGWRLCAVCLEARRMRAHSLSRCRRRAVRVRRRGAGPTAWPPPARSSPRRSGTRKRMTYQVGPFNIIPGQNEIGFRTDRREAAGRRLDHAHPAGPHLRRRHGAGRRRDPPPPRRLAEPRPARTRPCPPSPSASSRRARRRRSCASRRATAIRYKASDPWLLNHMIHNLTPVPTQVYMVYEVDFIPRARRRRAGIRPVRPIWMDVAERQRLPGLQRREGLGKRRALHLPDRRRATRTAAARRRTSGSSTSPACSSRPPDTSTRAGSTPTCGCGARARIARPARADATRRAPQARRCRATRRVGAAAARTCSARRPSTTSRRARCRGTSR